MIDGVVPSEIREGPAAIRATVDSARDDARDIAGSWLTAGVRRVHVIGNGTSYHSSLAAATLYRHRAGPDDPVVIPMTAAEFLVYPPVLGPRDAVVGISSSGEFKDVVAVAEGLRGRIPMAGIVHVPGSTLTTRRVGHRPVGRRPVGRPGHDEDLLGDPRRDRAAAARAPRRGARQPRGRGDPARRGRRRGRDRRRRAARRADRRDPRGRAPPVRHRGRRGLPGGARGGAQAQGDGARPRRGRGGLGDDLGRRDDARTGRRGHRARTRRPGAGRRSPSCWPTRPAGARGRSRSEPEPLVATSTLLPLARGRPEDHAPLCAVPPVALLAFALARQRGANPDRPGWIERYHSQGLRHILGAGEEEAVR